MPDSPANEFGVRRALRMRLREARAQLSASEAAGAAEAAAIWLGNCTEFRRARRIGAYVAVRGELDPALALDAALTAGKEVFLPRVTDDGALRFLPWKTGAPLRSNRFGIPEPVAEKNPGVSPATLDLVLVPLVGFNRAGIRLGTGGGYYDRGFAFKRRAPAGPPWLAGFAYASQECPVLVAASWDVPLDLVVTERGITRFNPALAKEP